MKSNNALIVILGTVTLDAVGIGLVMPVLPGLLRDIVHSDSIASHYGVLLALYALMQFLCAPVLGALSDRFGRRPVLLASLLGATIDYAIMATTPVLWILYAGRIVAGITGATGAVAGAYIADITDGEDRARHFGLMSACFGVGMVAGPVAGGLLGAISLHAPFLAAAVLNGLNLLLGCFLMQESHKGERRPIPCLPPRVASRCMEPGHLDLNGSRRHLANGFTTPRIGANQFLRRTVNAQTNPWQNISIASAISSSRTRRISGSVGSWPRVRMIVLLSLRTRLGWRGCLTG